MKGTNRPRKNELSLFLQGNEHIWISSVEDDMPETR